MDYWTDGSDRRLILVRGGYLYALDPETGHARPDFGDGGRVDLIPASARRFSWSSGPIVVNDVIVVAGTVDGAGDRGMRWKGSTPENLRGYDVRTGELLWTFNVVPQEGEFRRRHLGQRVVERIGRPRRMVLPQRGRGARFRVRALLGTDRRLLRGPSSG